MCWNAPVSMVFGLVGLACAAFLLYVGLKADKDPSSTRWGPDAKWHALWVANIACVELSEFVIWLNVLPFFDEQGIHPPNGGVCPTWNKIGTFGVYFFGFANWSWLIGVWCYKTCEGTERKKAYYVYSGFSILVSVFWWCATCDLSCTTNLAHGALTHHPPSPCVRAAILAGEIFDIGVGFVMQAAGGRQPVFISVTDSTTYVGPLANQGDIAEDLGAMKVQTCSFNEVGTYSHLHWRFTVADVPWMPSMGWTFFATMFFPFFFYRPLHRALAILFWGAVTYITPILLLPVEETMSIF